MVDYALLQSYVGVPVLTLWYLNIITWMSAAAVGLLTFTFLNFLRAIEIEEEKNGIS